MKPHRIALAAAVPVAVALSIVPIPSIRSLSATASAEPCPNTEVVFARGTGEPPGVGNVGNAFVSALQSKLPDQSVGAYGVNYPASYNFLAATSGANDVTDHIQYMVDNCPGTRLVLGGYSQGAAVMDIVTAVPVAGVSLSQPLSPAAADRVAAVALFGNPSKRLGNVVSVMNQQYAGKTIDLCSGADPICSDGRNWSAHTQYVQGGMTNQAAAFVAQRL